MDPREVAKSEFLASRENFLLSYKEFLEKLMLLVDSVKEMAPAEDARVDIEQFGEEVLGMRKQVNRAADGRDRDTASRGVSASTAGIQPSSDATQRSHTEYTTSTDEMQVEVESQPSHVTTPAEEEEEEEEEAARRQAEREEEERQERERQEEERERLRRETEEEEERQREEEEEEQRRREEEEEEQRRREEEEEQRRREEEEEEERRREEEEQRRLEEEEELRRQEEERRRHEEERRRQEEERRRREEEEEERERQRLEAERRERERLETVLEEGAPIVDERVGRIVSAFCAFRYHRKDFQHLFQQDQGDSYHGSNSNSNNNSCEDPWAASQPPWLRALAAATVSVLRLGRSAAPPPPALWSRLAAGHCDGASPAEAAFDAIPPLRRLEPRLRLQAEAMLLALQLAAGR